MNIIKKMAAVAGSSMFAALAIAVPASAHVVVKPAEVLTGSFQTFSVSAPNEKDQAFTSLKLTVPDGVKFVTPSVKAGWTITEEKTGEGETAVVTAITWAGGSVDPGFRDDFTFSAKVPDNAGKLEWKAYQTYADGTLVSWDQQETATDSDNDSANTGPLSVTKVVTETAADSAATVTSDKADSAKQTAQVALYTAVAALFISLGLLVYALVKK